MFTKTLSITIYFDFSETNWSSTFIAFPHDWANACENDVGLSACNTARSAYILFKNSELRNSRFHNVLSNGNTSMQLLAAKSIANCNSARTQWQKVAAISNLTESQSDPGSFNYIFSFIRGIWCAIFTSWYIAVIPLAPACGYNFSTIVDRAIANKSLWDGAKVGVLMHFIIMSFLVLDSFGLHLAPSPQMKPENRRSIARTFSTCCLPGALTCYDWWLLQTQLDV